MTFQYLITGIKAGSLTVYIKDLTNGTSLAWTDSGTSAKDANWRYGSFAYYTNRPHRIWLEGSRGGSTGYMAIADIVFKESAFCRFHPESAYSNSELTFDSPPAKNKTKPIVPQPNKSVYDCNFESGFCNWKNSIDNSQNWTRQNTYFQTGPHVDHTKGKGGWYLYVRK
jgi:hypothetical protein